MEYNEPWGGNTNDPYVDGNPSLGIVRWRWRLYNQDDAPVLDTEVTSLFDLAGNVSA